MGNLPLQQQWVYDWLTSDINGYVVFTVTISASIIHPILFILHFYRKLIKTAASQNNMHSNGKSTTNEASKTSEKSVKSQTQRSRTNTKTTLSRSNTTSTNDKRILKILKYTVDITTLSAIFFGWLATIFTLINYLEVVSNPNTCLPITILQNICWIFTKLCIYHVLIIRLQIAFYGSIHEYNRTLMFTAYIFVTIVCIICIIGSIIDVESIHFVAGWCLFIIPTWIILMPCALDVICSLFALYLFMKPLKQMLNNINLEENCTKKHIHKNKLALSVSQLITKLILLTIIAVVSNLFGGIFFAVTDIALGSFIDTLINPICLVLMEILHKDIYRKICRYCHIGIHKIVHHKNESIRSRPFGSLIIVDKDKDDDKGKDNKEMKVETVVSDSDGETPQCQSPETTEGIEESVTMKNKI